MLNALAIDNPLEYARLYLNSEMQIFIDAENNLDILQNKKCLEIFYNMIYKHFFFIGYALSKYLNNSTKSKKNRKLYQIITILKLQAIFSILLIGANNK